MSNVNRIDKLVTCLGHHDSMAAASLARAVPMTIRVTRGEPHTATLLARTLTSLGLRSCTGLITIIDTVPGWTSQDRNRLRQAVEEEAATYGQSERIRWEILDEDALSVTIGPPEIGRVTIAAAGWIVGINRWLDDTLLPAYAPAAVFAACAGMAKAFAFAVLGQSPTLRDEAYWFDLSSMQVVAQPPSHPSPFPLANLGRIGLLGGGAIGSGVLFTLRHSTWSANVEVIDFDVYQPPNKETTLLIHQLDYGLSRKKAEALAERAQRPGLRTVARPFDGPLTGGEPILQDPWDRFIVAVDKVPIRRALDHVNAKLLVNGGVGGTSADAGHALCSWHRVGYPLLSTLYREGEDAAVSEPVPIEFLTCGRISFQEASMAAPFISVASAALLVAACALDHPSGPPVSYCKMDLLRTQRYIDRRLAPNRSSPISPVAL